MIQKIKTYLATSTRIKKISDAVFIVAVTLSAYAMISAYIAKSKLPEGVCPINDRSELYQVSIGLLITALVLSFFDRRKKEH